MKNLAGILIMAGGVFCIFHGYYLTGAFLIIVGAHRA